MQTRLRYQTLLALCLCVGGNMVNAAESYSNCTGFVDAVPATITTQGTWCLRQDLSTAITAGPAINITTNNVTVDCNDFKLGGLAAGPGTGAIGINANLRANVTVRNCNIRGFYAGIFISGANWSYDQGGHLIENNRLESNTQEAIALHWVKSGTIRNNLIYNTGGSPGGSDAEAIWADGAVDVINNTIRGVKPTAGSNGRSAGIFTHHNLYGSVRDNRISGVAADGTGWVFGIQILVGSSPVIERNHLFSEIASNSWGIICTTGVGPKKALLRDNIVNGFATQRDNCLDGGGNFDLPLPP